MLKNLQENRGYTFVELLISITILALISTAIIGVMSSNGVIFRKSKADLDVQNVALDTFNQIENDVMQAKYIYIEADGKKYTNYSDKNLLANGGESIIDTLIGYTASDLDTLYEGFDTSDPSGDKRKRFDSYYNKVRYMSEQDKVIYYAFLESDVGDGNNDTFQSLTKSDTLNNITLLRVVYPVTFESIDGTSYTYTTTLPDGVTQYDETIKYAACVVDYTFDDTGKMFITTKYWKNTTDGTYYKAYGARQYTDIMKGGLSAIVDCKNNSIQFKSLFEKNNRKYNADRTITIRNSYVLRDQEDVVDAPTPSPTP